jgi:hypothetical protein
VIYRDPASGKANPLGPGHAAVEAEVAETMKSIGRLIGGAMPESYGFALLIFGMNGSGGGMNYMSNARREDMILAMKELIGRMEGTYGGPGNKETKLNVPE